MVFADSGRFQAGIGGLKGFFPVLWERPAHTQNGGGAEALRPRPPWRFRAGAGAGGGGVRAGRGREGPLGWSPGAPGITPGSGGNHPRDRRESPPGSAGAIPAAPARREAMPGCCRLRERTGDPLMSPRFPLTPSAGINIPCLCFPCSASQISAHRAKSCGCT